MTQGRQGSNKIALSAILLAFCISTLFFQSVFPFANFTIYIISSLYIAIVLIEIGIPYAILFYFASCILSFLVVPNKVFLVPYFIFFGIYGLVKFGIEKIGNMPLEIILKLVIFNVIASMGMLFIRTVLFQSISLPDLPIIIVVVIFEIAFLAYDYFYTLFIDFYIKRIRKLIRL